MRGIGKYILTFLMVGVVSLLSGVATQVLAGTCDFQGGNLYSESKCQAASTGANNTSCGTGGYAYYSCNYNGWANQWEYCYGCHSIGPGETPPPTPKPPAECNGDYISKKIEHPTANFRIFSTSIKRPINNIAG